jgi:phosphoserine phosphatase
MTSVSDTSSIEFQRVISASPAELDEAFPSKLLLSERLSNTLEFRSYDLTTHLVRGYVNPAKADDKVEWTVVPVCE